MLRYLAPALVGAALSASATVAQSLDVVEAAPFARVSNTSVPAHLSGSVAVLQSNDAAWTALGAASTARLTNLPLGPNRTVNAVLTRFDPFTSDAILVEVVPGPGGTLVERPLARPAMDFFHGIVEGEPDSRVVIARTPAGIAGFVGDSHGTAIISSGRPGSGSPVVSYQLSDLPDGAINWAEWSCNALPAGDVSLQPSEGGAAGAEPCRQMRIAVDSDNEFFATFGSTASAAGYAATIFAGVLDIYSRDVNVRPQVSYLRLWATPADPWTGSSSGAQLTEFRNYWQSNMGSVSRHVAHFLSTRGLGGGVAWLSALCGDYGYAVSGNLNGYFPYPLQDYSSQNWDINVVAHELGHNCGAPHTHNYCPPADECAPDGYFGSCQSQQVCTNQGTIMSYCHLCGGGMANIQLRFHQFNIDSIYAHLNSIGCTLNGASLPPVGAPDQTSLLPGATVDLDVLANDIALNCDSISLSGAPTASSQGGTVVIVPGAGPQGRSILRYTAPANGAGPDTFWYRVQEAGGQESSIISVSADITVLRAPENPVGDTAGLDVAYFVLSNPSSLPRYDTLTPYLVGTATSINYASTNGNFAGSGRSDQVGAQWTGWIRIDTPGIYTFYTNSDDGSSLLIGNATVVNNDGLHGMQERSGSMGLQAGKHAITVNFFENGGGAGCIVQFAGPGVSKQTIPASRFTRGGSVNPYDLTGDGTVNGADLGVLLAAFGTANTAADFDGNGVVDGADLGALLAAWSS